MRSHQLYMTDTRVRTASETDRRTSWIRKVAGEPSASSSLIEPSVCMCVCVCGVWVLCVCVWSVCICVCVCVCVIHQRVYRTVWIVHAFSQDNQQRHLNKVQLSTFESPSQCYHHHSLLGHQLVRLCRADPDTWLLFQ